MDRLERLIRSASPANEPLSARAEADLARILATVPDDAAVTDLRRRPRARWMVSIAAAVVLVLAIGVASVIRPQHAYAATPPMLAITPLDTDAPTALRHLADLAASQPDVSAETDIITQWWALATELDETGEVVSSRVTPVRRISTLGPDGLLRYTDYVGQAYDARGNPVDDPDTPAVGTKLGTVELDSEDHVFPAVPPEVSSKFGPYLTGALPKGSRGPSAHSFAAIAALLGERILTPLQNTALTEYLATLPDLALLGESTDRLGRPVIVFAAPINPKTGTQAILMLSTETGRVAATETIYRGAERTDIPSPAVLEYMAWEAP